MLQERSICNVADNSGAGRVMLFAVNGKNNTSSARIGTIVVGSVKKASPVGKVKKGQIVYGVIVRTTLLLLSTKQAKSLLLHVSLVR
jgi:large subunit ribosomal protein L14